MASSDAQAIDPALRRVHSTGDIPRSPELAHLQERLQALQVTLDAVEAARAAQQNQRRSTLPHHARSMTTGDSPITLPPSAYSNQRPTSSLQPYLTTHVPTARHAQNNDAGHDRAPLPINHGRNTPYTRLLTRIGLGPSAPRSRKIFVRFAWNIIVDTTQFVTILTLLILTSQLWKSKTDPSLSEWTACDRPLGAWASFWLIRLGCSIHVARSEYRHNRRRLQLRDPEAAGASSPSSPAPISVSGRPVDQNNTSEDPRPIPRERSRRRRTEADHNYRSRLSLLTTFMTLVWFLTAHILEYASINTCRHTSPHLWWLVFGILCLMYLMIAEVVLLAVTLLIIAPIIIVSWNLFLYCIGRHPIQNPHQINPDIGKLPKAIVERIPLVTYIPPPPENEGGDAVNWTVEYPPKPRMPVKPKTGRFKFLRRLKSQKGELLAGAKEDSTKKPEQVDWEEKWETGDYPFVILEENRAACSICLLDFVAPQRKDQADEEKETVSGSANAPADAEKSDEIVQKSPDGPSNEAGSSTSPGATPNLNETGPTLADAGEDAQPLRLLECGHVFHKTCLDPWLLDVSGRCPVCQRPVRTPEKEKNTRQRRA